MVAPAASSSSSTLPAQPPQLPLPPASSQPHAMSNHGDPHHPRKRARGSGQARTQKPREVIAVLQSGIQVIQDEHLSPGQPGFYRRVLVQCPHHAGGPQPCSRTRNWGAAQTAHFGEMEPAGYLAAWVRAGPRFHSREEHMAREFQPTLADVETAMRAEGWLR